MDNQPPPRQRKTRTGSGAAPTPPQTEYIYHWNRIIAAVVVLVLIVGLLGLGIRAWLSDPAPASADAGPESVEVPELPVEAAPGSRERQVAEPAPEPVAPEVVQPPAEESPPAELPAREPFVPESLRMPESAQSEPSAVFLPPDTRVNLRADPSLASPVLRILEPGTELELLDIGEDFYQVRSDDGVVGWVSREYSSLAPYPASQP
ncbi:MAG: SH3 domain-containing protein [Thioalkalivibrio sp.]|nr:MAG: SH3 domain-containing protein [Thioalkalivibrio sp.]